MYGASNGLNLLMWKPILGDVAWVLWVMSMDCLVMVTEIILKRIFLWQLKLLCWL